MIARWIRAVLKSLLVTAVLALLVFALFVAYRVLSYKQEDSEAHLALKRQYLERLEGLQPAGPRPNIVFILYDDMGYGDIGAGVSNPDLIRTPNIDAIAQRGVTLSQFYSPSPVCTPSRAGFLTGRLAPRAGLPYVVFPSGSLEDLAGHKVMNPGNPERLPAEEITLADVLLASGYRTAMVGKWHLGDRSPSLPNDFGFEYFFGSLYSNDMRPFALYRNREEAIPAPVDQRNLSRYYQEEVKAFLQREDDRPFFLYLAHNFPHDPLSVADERRGKSAAGLYGDVLEELDEGVGDLVSTLEQRGQLENTLIVISSDNGPWFLGDTGSRRGRKGSTFEGGMRVPMIVQWPAGIAGGRVEPAMAMGTDLLPTILDMLDLPPPEDRELDGRSILPLLVDGAPSPHEFLYFYDGVTLFAARDQRFKYRAELPVAYSTDELGFGFPVPQKAWLFDLQGNPGESYDTSDRYPEALHRLRNAYGDKREEMRTNPRGWR
ncbi:sulfatase [Haliea sp. E17]|uniref:sulfatase family protein n=1 Tax=Haliea sp. E17 TaxID=3401576 RepID=UPI003AABD26C